MTEHMVFHTRNKQRSANNTTKLCNVTCLAHPPRLWTGRGLVFPRRKKKRNVVGDSGTLTSGTLVEILWSFSEIQHQVIH